MLTITDIKERNQQMEAEKIRKYAERHELPITIAIADQERDDDYVYADWYCVNMFKRITGRLPNDLEAKEMRLSKHYKGSK